MRKYAICLISLLSIALTACDSSESSTQQNTLPAAEQNAVPGAVQIDPDNPDEFVFEPFTPIDNDVCSVTVNGLNVDAGFTIELELENKSADTIYVFRSEQVAINGVSTYGNLYADVPAGSRAIGSINLDTFLKSEGVGKYTDIEITMTVGAGYYSDQTAVRETFHIYPYGEEKAEKFVREPKETDRLLSDNDTFKCIVRHVNQVRTSPQGPVENFVIGMFVENKTDSTISLQTRNVSVNDYMVDGGTTMTIGPEHCSYLSLYIPNEQLEFNEIETIEKVEYTLQAIDPGSYEQIYSETVTVNP